MGLFNRLGREVEEFRQNAKRAAEEGGAYECRECGAQFAVDYEACPDCESEAVASTKSESKSKPKAETESKPESESKPETES